MLKSHETHFFGQVGQKALIFNRGKILLVQYPQNAKLARGKWDMPGGRLNEGEDALTGLKREVFEEIGVEIAVEKILAVGAFTNLSDQKVFFLIYKASLVDENQSLKLEEAEIGDFRWCDPKEFFTLPIVYKEYQTALKTILVQDN